MESQQKCLEFLEQLTREELISLLEVFAGTATEWRILSEIDPEKPVRNASFDEIVYAQIRKRGEIIVKNRKQGNRLLPEKFAYIKKRLPDWEVPDECYHASLKAHEIR